MHEIAKESDSDCRRKVAVLIPCYNEQRTIGRVIADLQAALPDATIFVYDNGSADHTACAARSAGAIVHRAVRVHAEGKSFPAYRRGRRAGNWLFTKVVAHIFGRTFTDILSGYRAFSYRFVKSFPVLSQGFEIETEMTVHALALRMPVGEISATYYARPSGSSSKLNTWRDGWRILRTILALYRAERPFAFFATLAIASAGASLALAIPLFVTYLQEGLVPRLPTAVLSTALMILAFLCMSSGLVLDAVARGRRETKLLAYLAARGARPGAIPDTSNSP